MKFTDKKVNEINDRFTEKKRENPIKGKVIGLGIELYGGSVVWDCVKVCEVDDLKRVIEELTMLKESIEEETGIIL